MTAYGRAQRSEGCIVRVCRDCCCGTDRKHPGVDHDGLLNRLEAGATGGARVLRSACLLACDESNVVVVTPSPEGRRRGARPVWVGGVLDDGAVDALVSWVNSGGPGIADLPSRLAPRAFPPSGLSLSYAHID